MMLSEPKMIFVAGFLICNEYHGDPARSTFLLVRKEKPDWQRGLWNAVGGKLERGELVKNAMAREFVEETGITQKLNWDRFCIEEGHTYIVHFFRSFLDTIPEVPPENDAGELLAWHDLAGIRSRSDLVGNLHWLIPMSLDWREILAKTNVISDIRKKPTW